MRGDVLFEGLDPALADALTKRGFTALTAVQAAVMEPGLEGRDLRISSQTGSGKTVALGLALRDVVQGAKAKGGIARPRALVVEPTRELAKQVELELAWLFEAWGTVASVTGGASYRDERRALGMGPAIVVGTPGRMLDYLQQGGISGEELAAVVLDEADRLLDMGFRDDLEAILSHAPEGHRTHLVSATFAPEVRRLADRVQHDPVQVEGTRLGTANQDIEHVIHLVEGRQRVDAVVNLLLADPEAQTLVFARTRADVSNIADELEGAGFSVRSLSGEMDQRARSRALESFKSGELHVLVATDVAARGIDVQDISRVIHVEPPNDADTYTHRSGRTGRAGRKGTSMLLVTTPALQRTQRLLREAGVAFRFAPLPAPEDIRQARAELVFTKLTAEDADDFPGFDDATWTLAKKLAESAEVPRIIARLLLKSGAAGVTEPRAVRNIEAPPLRALRPGKPGMAPGASGGPSARGSAGGGDWVPFRVTWGWTHGADARRLLALVCRRGNVESREIGAIRLDRHDSLVEVTAESAEEFEKSASRPDARDPRVTIRREAHGSAPARGPAPRQERREPRSDRMDRSDRGEPYTDRNEIRTEARPEPREADREPRPEPEARAPEANAWGVPPARPSKRIVAPKRTTVEAVPAAPPSKAAGGKATLKKRPAR